MTSGIMKHSVRLGKLAGIRVYVHWTFVFLLLWVVGSHLQAGKSWTEIGWTLALVMALFGCVTLHELGHALMARRYRIPTRDITLLPIGGIARLESLPEDPPQELAVALAGPVVNIVIAALLFPFSGWRTLAGDMNALLHTDASNFLFLLMTLNVWLAVFNLIPAFPMDGGRVLRALLGLRFTYMKATTIATWVGKVISVGFVMLGLLYNPFLFFIGLYVFFASAVETKAVASRQALRGYTVEDALTTDLPVMDASLTVREASELLSDKRDRHFIIRSPGTPDVLLNRTDVTEALRRGAPDASLRTLRSPADATLLPHTPLEDAFRKMTAEDIAAATVREGDQIIGIVDEDKLAEFILYRLRANGTGKHQAVA